MTLSVDRAGMRQTRRVDVLSGWRASGGRGAVPDRAGDRHVVELDALAALRSSRPPRLMSPRPTKSTGNRSRSPKISSSTSTYFGDAMLPSSTTSQSRPDLARQRARALLERPAVARRCRDRCRRRRTRASPSRVTSVSGLRRPAFGVMMCTPRPTTGLPARAAPRTAARRSACRGSTGR